MSTCEVRRARCEVRCEVRRATCSALCDVPRAACKVRRPHVAPHRAHGTRHRTSHVARRTSHLLITAIAVVIGGSSNVFACPMCFGAEESSLIDGAKLGIMVLLAITLAVQGAFVGFFFYLRKRAKHIAEVDLDDEWSGLQRRSRTS